MISSAYLRLLIFLLATLIPACDSSSPALRMMYSAYKLNKQDDSVQPWCTPSAIWNQSIVPCLVLTVDMLLRNTLSHVFIKDNSNKRQESRMFFMTISVNNYKKMIGLVNYFRYLFQGPGVICKAGFSWDSLLCILCLG